MGSYGASLRVATRSDSSCARHPPSARLQPEGPSFEGDHCARPPLEDDVHPPIPTRRHPPRESASPTESWRVAAPTCPAALLREPGSVQERRLRRDHEQGQRVEPAIERCPRMEHRPDRGPGRWTRGPRRSRLSRDVSAGFAARPPPHHPERNLPISGPAGSLRVIFHTVAAQTPSRWRGVAVRRRP